MATGVATSRAAAPTRPARSRPLLIGALAVTALALVIRFSTLTLQSLWLDEAYTAHLVHLGLGAMLREIPKSESTPPLYYLVAWVWTHAFGYSELALRSVSAIAGAATVTVGYAIAARLGGLRAALIAGVLIALSPILIWFSQEARAYALATLLATLSLLCLIRYLDASDRRWLAAWTVAAALGLCTHYFLVFIVAPEVAWLINRGRDRREVQLALAVLLLVAAALVPLALAQRGTGHADYIAQGSLGTRTVQVPKQFLIGYASPLQAVTGPLVTVLVLAGSAWPLIRYRASIDRATLIPLAVGLLCVIVPIVLALVGIDFLNTRNVLVALPALLVVASVGFAVPRWPPGAVLAGGLALLLAVIVVLVDTDPHYQRTDWRGASSALGADLVPRAIVVNPGAALLPMQAYLPHLHVLAGPARVAEIDLIALPSQGTGTGLGPAPRPTRQLPIPPGFHIFKVVYNGVYTVLRLRASGLETVTPTALEPDQIAPGSIAILVQRPAG